MYVPIKSLKNANAFENLILNAKQDTLTTSKWIKYKSVTATDKKCLINSCKMLEI